VAELDDSRIAHRRFSAVRADIPFVFLAVASGIALLYLGRSLTFFHDEWRSITFDGGPIDYLRPVNEHWSTLPLLLYRATFRVVELHSYLPYLAEVIVLHLLAVSGAYALMRARIGPLVAALAAIPLLLLGSGAENLFWAFQTGFVGSVMFGVWALFFIERPGTRAPVVASLLLVAALASSGMGLFFLVAAAGRAIFDSSLRMRVLAVVPPAAVYLVWFALVGRDAVGDTGRLVVDLAAVRFAIRGITFTTEVVPGLDRLPEGYLWGLLLFIGLSVLTGWRIGRGLQSAALAAGCLLGLASMYTLIAFVRADLEVDYANASRYVYVAAFFLVLGVVDLLPRRDAWSRIGTRTRVAIATALGVGLALTIAANVDALAFQRSEFQRKADLTRAFTALAVEHGDAAWVDKNARLGVMPAVPELLETIRRHGSPLEDRLVPTVVTTPGAVAREAALLAIVGDRFRVGPATASGNPVRMDVVSSVGLARSNAGTCVRALIVDDRATVTVAVAGGARIRVSSSPGVVGDVRLGHERPPSRRIDLELGASGAREVVVPDVGDGRPWRVEVDLSGAAHGRVTLCASRADDSGR
jgi:hypothetical protein